MAQRKKNNRKGGVLEMDLNALETLGLTGALPVAPPSVPPMPAGLRAHVEALITPHVDVPLPATTSELQVAARTHRQALVKYLLPASPEVIATWLWPVAGAVEYLPGEDEYSRRLSSLLLVSDQMPWIAWNRETQRAAVSTFKRLPSVAAILELVTPSVSKILAINR